MLQKFKEIFKKKKEEIQAPDPIDPIPEAPFVAPETKRKIKHRKRGDRHGVSLREARKMGVAE